MKETLKSIVIVLLTLSSVFFLLLNFGLTPSDLLEAEEEESAALIFDSNVIMRDAVMPTYIGVNFESDEHTVINNPRENDIWGDLNRLLAQIFEKKGQIIRSIEVIDSNLYRNFLDQKSLVLFFNEEITTLTFLNALKIEEPKELATEINHIESLYISLDKHFIVLAGDKKYHLITFDLLPTDKINEKISNLYIQGFNPYYLGEDILELDTEKSRNFTYIPVLSEHKIQKVVFENILGTLSTQNIENIVYRFFQQEVNYLREIKEEGVQSIYVDDDGKILKINDNGLISYFNPEEINVKERNLYISLENALAFISNNLGYDPSLYLKEIQPIEFDNNLGFKMIFGKSAEGLKVELLDDEIVDYVEIDIFNEHIRCFSQLFRGEASGNVVYYNFEKVDDLRPTIARNIDEIRERITEDKESYTFEEILKLVEKARVVYGDRVIEDELPLMWKIVIKGEEFYFPIDAE